MRIGVPKELKPGERRVALTPTGTRELVTRGHQVLVEAGAGVTTGLADDEFAAEGARVVAVDEVFGETDLILKVKEPQRSEIDRLAEDQVLFTYLHLAADPELAQALCDSGATCIAYETVEAGSGPLPLLAPMSEIAGRVATQVGAESLMSNRGGLGKLLGGVPGVEPARVVILGGGVAGTNAARIALGMGADTVIVDKSVERLRALDAEFGFRAQTAHSSSLAIEALVREADLVVGAVLVTAARAPHLVSRALLSEMHPGSVVVDISIDQGGCFESSRPTTHANPTFVVDGVLHYCVANVPAAVPRTSTYALTNATLPYVLQLAELGVDQALAMDPGLAQGVNVANGSVTHPVVSAAVDVGVPAGASGTARA